MWYLLINYYEYKSDDLRKIQKQLCLTLTVSKLMIGSLYGQYLLAGWKCVENCLNIPAQLQVMVSSFREHLPLISM